MKNHAWDLLGYANKYLITSLPSHQNYSRVHITKTTLDYLDDKFEVEPGTGSTREQYLSDHKIETYLIVPPKVRRVKNITAVQSSL